MGQPLILARLTKVQLSGPNFFVTVDDRLHSSP
jgi:hypothetical protein